jgi:succinate dehydrogenase / fumarate reductase, cytochrome b subunit
LDNSNASFFGRHQFLIYRLFSLAGLIPIGGYLVVHLLTNSTVLNGPGSFQAAVNQIHSLGILLPLVEWTFIFIPILFHASIGLVIIAGGMPNANAYPYSGNIRYTLQRATGMIVFAFIIWHVIQMHHLGTPLGGGKFDPDHATSSTAMVLSPFWIRLLYAIGVLCAVYHLSNGLWTQGITWGVWTTPAAMRRAGYGLAAFGLFLGVVGLGALYGMSTADIDRAKIVEQRMLKIQEYEAGAPSAPNPISQSAKD